MAGAALSEILSRGERNSASGVTNHQREKRSVNSASSSAARAFLFAATWFTKSVPLVSWQARDRDRILHRDALAGELPAGAALDRGFDQPRAQPVLVGRRPREGSGAGVRGRQMLIQRVHSAIGEFERGA